jgi:hypothetical protein
MNGSRCQAACRSHRAMVPDRAGDYSAWMRDAIKDEDLAAEFAAVERDRELSADDSRARIKAAIDRRYTGPAAEGRPAVNQA